MILIKIKIQELLLSLIPHTCSINFSANKENILWLSTKTNKKCGECLNCKVKESTSKPVNF